MDISFIQKLLDEVADDFIKDHKQLTVPTEDLALKISIENKFLNIEHKLSSLLIEVGTPTKIRPIVDTIVEHCISLIRYVDNQKADKCQADTEENIVCKYYGNSTCLFIFNIRRKYNYLSTAQLECPKLYVDFFKDLMKDKVQEILVHMEKAAMPPTFIEAMSDYFQSPIPTPFSVSRFHDGFSALDYFYGLIEVLYERSSLRSNDEYRDAVYYELINRNFNRLEFIRAAIESFAVTIDEDTDIDQEIMNLLEKKKKIAVIPSISGISYIDSEECLQNALFNAISAEINFLKDYQTHKATMLEQKYNPQFSNNFNIWQLLFLFNAMINLGFWMRVGKLSIPEFVHLNFVRSDGEHYSLKSLSKKNSNIDRVSAQKLIEALKKIIDYITKNYLLVLCLLDFG
ncbi:MAG: hypothetical protein LBF27_30925 [Sphingobacterium sp.]|jgi:hypothetical protein|nr:hypothetical protein [Sphingobacterium sp.]